MGVTLQGESIMRVLANANEDAKRYGEELAAAGDLEEWRAALQILRADPTPKTYLALTAVLLTARAMYPSEKLDVLAIKAGKDPRGYSASSIGTKLASFAKEQGIDLRANSSSPLNNQPFTFKERILEDMGVQPKFEIAWRSFYYLAQKINDASPADAARVLSLLFHMCRRVDAASVSVKVRQGGKASLDKVAAAVAQFTSAHVDGGKVGQAFVAGVLDLLYGAEQVILGDTQDPDASTPGDVQVKDSTGVWLWAEAKQKVIGTGDITGFLRQVRKAGGERVVYFALVNSGYSGQIKPEGIEKEAESLGVGVKVVESAEQALDWFLPMAPGSYATVASALLERTRARLVQSQVKPSILAAFDDLARKYAELA
jgi:hypothetical protein